MGSQSTRLALALQGLAALVLLIGMRTAAAQEAVETAAAAAQAAPTYDKGDISWMLVSTLLVLLLMGFAVFRRTVLRPRLIPMSHDAAAILGEAVRRGRR